MNLRLIIYSLLLITHSVSGQSRLQKVLAHDSSSIYVFNKENITIKNFRNSILDTIHLNPSENIDFEDLKMVVLKGVPHLVSKEGGMVWEVVKDSLKRIDNSFNHKNTSQSDVFVRNDTIFKFGGYGYWGVRNFFTYFSKTTAEWQFYGINPQSYIPKGLSHFNASYHKNSYYISGGVTIDEHDGTNELLNTNVWKFDFNTKLWSDLGTSKFESYDDHNVVDIGNGRQLVFRRLNKTDSYVIRIIDYVENSIEEYDNSNPIMSIDGGFFARDSLYTIKSGKLSAVNLKDFTNESTDQTSLYLDASVLFERLTLFIVSVLILLFGGLVLLYCKNRKRPRLTDSGFYHNYIHYPLSNQEQKVLGMLLYSKNINSKLLLEELNDSSSSTSYNNLKKLEVIDSLNEKISKVFGTKTFIRSKMSTKDENILIYFTNYRKEFVL